MNTEVAIFPYVVRFGIAYAVALIVFAIITSMLGLDGGAGSSMGALIAAVAVAASKFVKDHERVPTSAERKKLTWASLAASLVVSAVLIGAVLGGTGQLGQLSGLLEVFSRLNLGLVFGVMLFVLALYALVLWFSYSGFAKCSTRRCSGSKGKSKSDRLAHVRSPGRAAWCCAPVPTALTGRHTAKC
ncbi:MAG: hypothetical protein H6961_07955 [Chromatiaceae bacterium]|nr:hypothetical protein [Chromatiaceae bacterium]